MNFKTIKRICIITFIMLLLSACASSKEDQISGTGSAGRGTAESMSEIAMPQAASEEAEASVSMDSESNSGLDSQIASGKKLIKTVSLNVETREFDDFIASITAQIGSLGGYVENSEVSGNSYQYENKRYSTIVARVPAEQLEGFLLKVGELGNVTFRQESVRDVTLQYVDIESHKKSLKIEQERLLVLLENAEKLEDIIAIETRLSEVRYELENYESQLRIYDNLIEYSTVTLYINEVERITPVDNESMWDKISSGFMESLYNVGEGLKDFATWFLVSIPYLLVWAVIIIIIIIIIRFILKKTGRKKIKKEKRVEIKVQTKDDTKRETEK